MLQVAAKAPTATRPIRPTRRPPEPSKPPSRQAKSFTEDALAAGPQGIDEQADALVEAMLAKARDADDPERAMLAQLAEMDSLEALAASAGGIDAAAGAVGAVRLNSSGFPMRPGKEPCHFYLRTGKCSYGSNCHKDHPEVSPAVASPSATVELNSCGLPLRPGMELCIPYVRTGTCIFGIKCVKHHPEMQAHALRTQTSDPVQLNSFGFPLRPGKEQCHFYLRTGKCSFGSKCVKDHPEMDASAFGQILTQAAAVVSQFLNNAWDSPNTSVDNAWEPHQPVDDVQLNSHGYPMRPGKVVCAYYMKTGKCTYGSKCVKDHPEVDAFGSDATGQGSELHEQSRSPAKGHDSTSSVSKSDWGSSGWSEDGNQSGSQRNWQEWENKDQGLDYDVTYTNESKTEAKLWLTMDGFKPAHRSRLIGKRGSNLTMIGKESGATVHLCGRDSNRPTDEENHLLIRGRQAQIEKAVQLAVKVIIDVLDFGFPICSTCGQAHKDRDCPQLVTDHVEKIRLDPKVKVGFVIGTGGRNVQPIKDKTGALIRVCGAGSGVRGTENEALHVRVACKTESQLKEAVMMMKSLIGSVENYSPYDDEPPEGHVFEHKVKLPLNAMDLPVYDDGLNAHIFGKGGQNLRKIHDLTGAWIWLRGAGSGVEVSPEPLHVLIEHDDEFYLEEAKKLVLELLDSVYEKVKTSKCKICGGPHFEYRCAKANSAGYWKDQEAKGCGKGTWQHIPLKRDAEIPEDELPSSKFQKMNPSPYEWPEK
eukprot:TRINITY_DN5754_c0_g1_i1.p1 TRINITY_DN5754_c0_g1~~TRINITY_DN5754_c0_g1_i1.p1  ORF type:complete len:759 (+),score=115.25 TRINITY_DN5754_c0_g1_i1:197-2473(+)